MAIEIRRDDDGGVDEIVAPGFHIEQMDYGQWWVSIEDGDERLTFNLMSHCNIELTIQEHGRNSHSTGTK